MAVSKQELVRQACEHIETCEKVLSMAFAQKKRMQQSQTAKDSLSIVIQ